MAFSSTKHHIPVLKSEFLYHFENLKIQVFVDGTLGAGGHARALLEHHPELKLLVGIDQDMQALELAAEHLTSFKDRLLLLHGNFSDMAKLLNDAGISKVDGIFLDLGVSSMQLDKAERGFSFLHEGPLDMRMNSQHSLSAQDIIKHWPEEEIGKIFKKYGEERHWRCLAREICKRRKKAPFTSTKDLAKFIEATIGRKGGGNIHPATRCFQALRIAVNDELGAIENVIPDAIDLLNSGGRLGIITFHSLEDRIVKNSFREMAKPRRSLPEGPDDFIESNAKIKVLTKKPLQATPEEISSNPRSRSAKLRFAEKI